MTSFFGIIAVHFLFGQVYIHRLDTGVISRALGYTTCIYHVVSTDSYEVLPPDFEGGRTECHSSVNWELLASCTYEDGCVNTGSK